MTTSLDKTAYRLAENLLAEGSFVSQERAQQHGGIINEYVSLAKIWSAVLGIAVAPEQAVVMMAMAKANRIMHGARDHRDHYLDGSNYFALAWGVRKVLNPSQEEPADEPENFDDGYFTHNSRLVPRSSGG